MFLLRLNEISGSFKKIVPVSGSIWGIIMINNTGRGCVMNPY